MAQKRDSFFLPNKKQKETTNKSNPKQHKSKAARQNTFDKNRENLEEKPEKKPFDKKTYRLKKYSKKYKLEQWEEQRKKKLLNEYQKSLKHDPGAGSYKPKTFDEDTTDSATIGRFVKHPDILEKENLEKNKIEKDFKTKRDPFAKAKEQFNKKKMEKIEKQKEIEKNKQDKAQKLQEYKKKKHERFKKLSKKTKKGQPVMTGRLELLLEKIQKG